MHQNPTGEGETCGQRGALQILPFNPLGNDNNPGPRLGIAFILPKARRHLSHLMAAFILSGGEGGGGGGTVDAVWMWEPGMCFWI